MKVSIIGGGGLVGSCAGFALQCGGVAREIALLDVNADLAAGQALDILHGGPSVADQIISSGSYEHVPSSDVVCITAGLRRNPAAGQSGWAQAHGQSSRGEQSSRHSDLRGGKDSRAARAAGHRPGDTARYHSLLQSHCRSFEIRSHANSCTDPGRTRR